jgi:hypothetical protein
LYTTGAAGVCQALNHKNLLSAKGLTPTIIHDIIKKPTKHNPMDNNSSIKWPDSIDPETRVYCKMEGVMEYNEGNPVILMTREAYEYKPEGHGRLVISATNEGGFNSTMVDLLQLIQWVKNNRPELLQD